MPKYTVRTIHKVKLEDLRPSPWRYSKATPTDRKLAYVLTLRGQTMPILVRDILSAPASPENVLTFENDEPGILRTVAAPGSITSTIHKLSYHEIIDGHRVWEAMKSNGAKTCTVVSVGEVPDVEALLMAVERNESRGPISHVRLAKAFEFLSKAGVKSDEIASRIDFDTDQVECYRRLVDFDLEKFAKGEGADQSQLELVPEIEDVR